MCSPKIITAKIIDMTSDGSLIIYGLGGEHIIIENGPAQIVGLKLSVDKYVDYYKSQEAVVA